MRIDVRSQGAFSHALVALEAGEEFISESGAMFRASPSIDIDVTTKTRGRGGILAGIKRLFSGDNFFFSRYSAEDAPGEVGLAAVLQGDVRAIELDGSERWLCAGGSYLGSSPELAIDTQFQGLKGMFTGESIFFLAASGTGTLLVSAFGRLEEVDVDGGLTVDTGHVVAFSEGLSYRVTKAGGSWLQSWLAGEGIVLEFEGRGKIYVQSHNPNEYGKGIGARLPPREA